MPAKRVSQLVGMRLYGHEIDHSLCEYRRAGKSRPVAVVGTGKSMTLSRWSGYLNAFYGVSSCGVYVPRADGGVTAACVDPAARNVGNSSALTFDYTWTAAAGR
jgi:hypothetical protein